MSLIKLAGALVFVLAVTACGKDSESASSGTQSFSSTSGLGSSLGTGGNYVNTPAVNPGRLKAGVFPADTPVSCDIFNPDNLRNQDESFIVWMAEIFPSGLTRHEHFMVVRDTGYDGEIGQGGHSLFLSAKAGRVEAFDRMIAAFAGQSTPPYATFRDHHVAHRAAGYRGVFLCGGHACWQAGQCDNLGRRK